MSQVARYFLALFLVHTTPSIACEQLFQQSFRYGGLPSGPSVCDVGAVVETVNRRYGHMNSE